MFHTLCGESLKTIELKRSTIGVQLPAAGPTKFYGSRSRSNTGCLCCRRRKKKCDETYPTCTRCKSRNQQCIWPDKKLNKTEQFQSLQPSTERSPTCITRGASISGSSHNKSVGCSVKIEAAETVDWPVNVGSMQTLEEPTSTGSKVATQKLQGFKDVLMSFQMGSESSKSGEEQHLPNLQQEEIYIPTEFLGGFGFPYLANLDTEGLRYLDVYRCQYSPFVAIGFDSSNYFVKTFLSIASSNESITFALTAWGGFFTETRKAKSDFTKPYFYMQRAAKCMCKQLGNDLQPKNQEDFYVLFAFYLIFIGIEVCLGDVRNWRGFMNQCSSLLRRYGGPEMVAKLFHHSNDIKFMIADFQFHDLLSSNALIHGPIFSVDDYNRALPSHPSYGIDPLHGIVGPLYEIFGKIGRAKAWFDQKWLSLSKQDLSYSDLEQAKIKFYDDMLHTIEKLRSEIANCVPQQLHLQLLENQPEDKKLHLSLFELYTYVCNLQLAITLEKNPPSSILSQRLLLKALPLIDHLQNTRLKVSLSLSLLVCGMACCGAQARQEMTRRFRLLSRQYEIGNLQRIEELVIEVWGCNEDGAICMDWADVAVTKDWHLYVG